MSLRIPFYRPSLHFEPIETTTRRPLPAPIPLPTAAPPPYRDLQEVRTYRPPFVPTRPPSRPAAPPPAAPSYAGGWKTKRLAAGGELEEEEEELPTLSRRRLVVKKRPRWNKRKKEERKVKRVKKRRKRKNSKIVLLPVSMREEVGAAADGKVDDDVALEVRDKLVAYLQRGRGGRAVDDQLQVVYIAKDGEGYRRVSWNT